jgi:flagellar biosynthetic protein FliR
MINVPLQPFFVFVLVFLRTGLLLSFFPVLGERFLPLRIRILVSAAVAIALVGVVPVAPEMFPTSMPGIIRLIGTEALLGMGLAFIGRLMFSIIQYSGQIIGQEIGFGLVNSLDPTAHQVTVVAEMQYMLGIMLFFALNLHHQIFQVLADSFTLLPPGSAGATLDLSRLMLRLGSTLFSLSIGFAMPVVAINFAINVAMGMVGRAVPQLNVFVESFPVRIIAGLSVMLLSLGFMASLWTDMFSTLGKLMNDAMLTMK